MFFASTFHYLKVYCFQSKISYNYHNILIKGRIHANMQPVSISYDEFQKEMLDLENEFMRDIRKSALVVYGIESYLNTIARFYS